jgi:hypothetical protein
MYHLNYVRLNSDANEIIALFSLQELYEFVEYAQSDNIVYLFTKDDPNDNEILISQWTTVISELIQTNQLAWTETGDFILQEFDSFEAAYDVAKLMKDGNPLCDKK